MCNHEIALVFDFDCFENISIKDTTTYAELIQFLDKKIKEELTESENQWKHGKFLRKYLFKQYVSVFNYCPDCGKKLNWGKMGNKINLYIDKKIKNFAKQEKIEENEYSIEEKKENLLVGYIYLIKADNYYKIGMTKNMKNRVKNYTEMPYVIEEIYSQKVKDYPQVEEYLLKKYADKRIKGEWFSLNSKDVDWIKLYLEGIKYENEKN